MAELTIPEGIVRFTRVLVEDASLRSWFLSLEQLPASARRTTLARMAEQMRSDKHDPELAAAVAAITRPHVFDAVRNALKELSQ